MNNRIGETKPKQESWTPIDTYRPGFCTQFYRKYAICFVAIVYADSVYRWTQFCWGLFSADVRDCARTIEICVCVSMCIVYVCYAMDEMWSCSLCLVASLILFKVESRCMASISAIMARSIDSLHMHIWGIIFCLLLLFKWFLFICLHFNIFYFSCVCVCVELHILLLLHIIEDLLSRFAHTKAIEWERDRTILCSMHVAFDSNSI